MSLQAVEKLAREIFTAEAGSARGRVTYLRMLVAATQVAVGASVRKHAAKGPKLSEADATAHLQLFNVVASDHYDAVMRAANGTLRKADVRSATGFARSAASTLRGYIRGRGDVRLLGTRTVTKAAIATVAVPRKPTAPVLTKRIEAASTALAAKVAELVKLDANAAHAALQPILRVLGTAAFKLSKPTRDAAVAKAESRPWQAGSEIFVPLNGGARAELRDAA